MASTASMAAVLQLRNCRFRRLRRLQRLSFTTVRRKMKPNRHMGFILRLTVVLTASPFGSPHCMAAQDTLLHSSCHALSPAGIRWTAVRLNFFPISHQTLRSKTRILHLVEVRILERYILWFCTILGVRQEGMQGSGSDLSAAAERHPDVEPKMCVNL